MATKYEYYNPDTGTTSIVSYSADWHAQTFTPSIEHVITSVKLKLKRTGSPGILTVSIRAVDGDGKPTGPDLTSGTTNGDTLTTNAAGELREIVLSPYMLSAGTMYAIVIRALSAPGDGSENIGWRWISSAGDYTGGRWWQSMNSGSSWGGGFADSDFLFEDWGVPGAVPTVTTAPATSVESASATLNGILAADGGEACDCGFEWGETIAYGNVTLTQSKETGETFAHLLGELSPATTYHFRAFATNSKGTSYGSDQSFTTPVGLPTLTTEAASAIGLNGATLNGALTSDGGEPCYCGFEWGETIAYGTTTATQRKVTGEVFSQPLLHLGEAAQYHFRAFATNSSGTAYGEDRTIDTLFRTSKAYALARYEV